MFLFRWVTRAVNKYIFRHTYTFQIEVLISKVKRLFLKKNVSAFVRLPKPPWLKLFTQRFTAEKPNFTFFAVVMLFPQYVHRGDIPHLSLGIKSARNWSWSVSSFDIFTFRLYLISPYYYGYHNHFGSLDWYSVFLIVVGMAWYTNIEFQSCHITGPYQWRGILLYFIPSVCLFFFIYCFAMDFNRPKITKTKREKKRKSHFPQLACRCFRS